MEIEVLSSVRYNFVIASGNLIPVHPVHDLREFSAAYFTMCRPCRTLHWFWVLNGHSAHYTIEIT